MEVPGIVDAPGWRKRILLIGLVAFEVVLEVISTVTASSTGVPCDPNTSQLVWVKFKDEMYQYDSPVALVRTTYTKNEHPAEADEHKNFFRPPPVWALLTSTLLARA